ncbi:MAG: histidine phosphatase family protein [Pseudomonadota bacterium]
MLPLKSFYVMRHSESEANRAGYFSGQKNVALTEQGIEQAIEARIAFNRLSPEPQIIIHSQLSRAKDTARLANENKNLKMIEDAGIAEHDFGDWVGQPWHEVKPLYYEQGVEPPNGETRLEFNTRIGQTMTTYLMQYDHPIFVCHGGVIRGVSEILNLSKPAVKNCAIFYFYPHEHHEDEWDFSVVYE